MSKRRKDGVPILAAVPSDLPKEETGKFIIDNIIDVPDAGLHLALSALNNSLELLKEEVTKKYPARKREFQREVRRAKQAFDLLNTGVHGQFQGTGKSGAGGDSH